VLACRWFADWRRSLLIVRPETESRQTWHHKSDEKSAENPPTS
jgi:hypothetical protein